MWKHALLVFLPVTLALSGSGCSFAAGKRAAKLDAVIAVGLTATAIVLVATDQEECQHVCGLTQSAAAIPMGMVAVGYGIGAFYGNAQGERHNSKPAQMTVQDNSAIEIEYERQWREMDLRLKRSRVPARGDKKHR